ncbi:MAG: ribonuclease HII [Myxococcota bacterium]
MSQRPASLSALRRDVRSACARGDLAGLAEIEASLRDDPRAGARELLLRCDRYRSRRSAEERRIFDLFALRRRCQAEGARLVAGVDEVGVGPLAGPVVAAAVILPESVELPGLNDSKKVPREKRERLAGWIREQALGFAIGEVSPLEIDRVNILQATLEAMRRAVAGLPTQATPDHVFVDARTIPGLSMPQTAIVNGDSRDASIAAASIVAKVYRDRQMRELDAVHPAYGFARNMGYPTPDHFEALRAHGPCEIHRRSFRPVSDAIRGRLT